jgi:hypothetical protein
MMMRRTTVVSAGLGATGHAPDRLDTTMPSRERPALGPKRGGLARSRRNPVIMRAATCSTNGIGSRCAIHQYDHERPLG